LPADAVWLAVIVDDDDASVGTFTHWLAWGISCRTVASQRARVRLARVVTDFREVGYRGGRARRAATGCIATSSASMRWRANGRRAPGASSSVSYTRRQRLLLDISAPLLREPRSAADSLTAKSHFARIGGAARHGLTVASNRANLNNHWLVARQERIEDRLARRHLRDGELVLYDVSSSYFEGRSCELARLGYSRDQKRGTPQIIYGPGRPIAVEVFSGELNDDKTLPSQIAKLKARFARDRVVVVSDRGMVTKANLELLREQRTGWITALKAPQIAKLVRDGALQLSLFDEHNLAEITAEEYPGERLVVCRNPLVAADRARKREELLCATERGLAEIAQRVQRGTLQGADQIGLAVGPALKRYRVKKHFDVQITDTTFTYQRKSEQIHAEAALDGIYVLRTSLTDSELESGEVVRSYKQLKVVERAFRTFKGPELEIRPIHHRLEDRVRAHVFLCMLAYYLTWHLRQAWAPLLFADEHPPTQPDPVAKAVRTRSAHRKAQSKRTTTDEPAHSYKSLLAELATLTRNTIRLPGTPATFNKLATPTTTQAQALELAETADVLT